MNKENRYKTIQRTSEYDGHTKTTAGTCLEGGDGGLPAGHGNMQNANNFKHENKTRYNNGIAP